MAGKRFRSSDARFSANNDVYVGNVFTGAQLRAPLTNTQINDIGGNISVQTNVLTGGFVRVTGLANTIGVNVFENRVIVLDQESGINVGAAGAHNYFINCKITMVNSLNTTAADQGRAFFTAVAGQTTNVTDFRVGDADIGRPEILTDEATSKANHFFGCSITAEGGSNAAFFLAIGQMEDCVLEYSGVNAIAGSGLQMYPHGGVTEIIDNDFVNNGTNANNVYRVPFSLQGNNGFSGNTFVGASPAAINDLNLTLNGYTNLLIDPASATIREYYRATATTTWIYSIDPAPRMSLHQAVTTTAVAGTGRIIEASSFNQQFTDELGAPTGGITAVLTGNSNFTTPGNIRTIQTSTTTPFSEVYTSSSTTGYLLGSFDPMNHDSGPIQFDADTPLVIPTFFRQSNAVQADFTNNIELRSFTNVVDATGAINIPITAVNQRARGIGSNQTIGAPGTYSTDTTVSLAARTASNITSYFNTALDTPSPQDISDALKYYHATTISGNIFTPNALYRTISGGIMNYGANITLSQTGTVGAVSFSSAAAGRGSAVVSGVTSLSAPADGDIINEISLLNGGTSFFDLDYGNLAIPSGWRFGRAEHVNFGPTTGTIVLNNILVDPNAELAFERGRVYEISNSDFTTFGVNFDGWSASGTTGDVTINLPIGDTSLSSAQETALDAVTNFNVVRAAVVSTRTFEIPSNLRNGFFAVRNITSNTELVAPVQVDPATESTYSFDLRSDAYNGTDMIRFYWRPTSSATAAYNTTIFDYTGAITATATQELAPNRIAAVLWENVVPSGAIPSGTSATIIDGSNDHSGVDRVEIQLIDANDYFNDATGAQVRTLLGIMLSTNDVNYLERLIDNELNEDYITAGINDTIIDGRYAYLDSDSATTSVVIGSVTNSDTGGSNITPIALTGVNGVLTVVIRANPDGATPGQIASAVNSAINTSNVADGVGFLVGNRLGTKGTAPYDSDTTYSDNL